jgi:hypothetical protein
MRTRRIVVGVSALALVGVLAASDGSRGTFQPIAGPYVVFATNDLGMHCMQDDFSEICILPPYNTVRAQVLRRGEEPDIVTSGITVKYAVPTNTRSSDKTNFWTFAPALFGATIEPDVGLTGHRLQGTMTVAGSIFETTGIPITPIDDAGRYDPYPLGVFTATGNLGSVTTRTVVPVSSEMSCGLCHGADGVSVAHDILVKHDAREGTHLVDQKPVLCASCHADPALGTAGQPGVSMLSHAMHTFHAPYVASLNLDNGCYACHPGIRTQCQRDVHKAQGIECVNCHGDMAAVGSTLRMPWADQPRCGDCHSKPGFEFEQPGKLFKDSVGHGGVRCTSCHGSPHAITPAITPVDNVQANLLQGASGVISSCTVCHTQMPDDSFFHKVDD